MKTNKFFPILIALFIFYFILPSNVKAQSYLGPPSNGIPLEYGARTFGYNFSSSTSTVNLTLDKSNGADGGVYYTDQNITTGTYGVGIGTLLNEPLIANHTYRIIYAVYFTGSNYCGTPNSWANQFYPTTGTTQADIANRSRIIQYDRLASLNVSVGAADIYSTELSYTIDTCYYFIAFTPKSYTNSLMLPFNTSSTVTGGFRYYGYNIVDLGNSSAVTAQDIDDSITDAQNAIIANQNANASQAHTDAQNTQNAINNLKDDTVSNNTGTGFFNNFSDNTHGLSSIITAPLNMVQQLINVSPSSCSDLSATYQGKTFSFSCGKLLWNHTGVSQFNDFYNLVVGGMLCYWIIRDLFLTIEALKDPDNDKVEVMSL